MAKATTMSGEERVLLAPSVIALDPAYSATGVAVFQGGEFREALTFERGNGMNKRAYRQKLGELLSYLCMKYETGMIVAEAPSPRPSQRTQLLLYGLLVSISDDVNAPLFLVNVASWKAKMLGNGKAKKEDALSYVKERLGYAPLNDHVADAMCIGLAALHTDVELKTLE